MPAPDPVAEAITRGLQAMIAADPPKEEPKASGIASLWRRLRGAGSERSER